MLEKSPTNGREGNEGIDEATMKEIIYDMFFAAKGPKTVSELGERLTEQAKQKGVSRDELEKEFMVWMSDEMANSVD